MDVVHVLRSVLFMALAVGTLGDDDGPVTFVSEVSSKPAQKLSRYSWFGSARLQRFHIPEDAAVARWLFSVTKGTGFHCGQHNVSIHMRWGAPPVINPVGTEFPNTTLWSPAFSLSLLVTSQSSVTFNLSDPAPGDWYIAAHLPEDDGRIEQKGFPSCTYFLLPQLSVRRAVDTPILQQATPLLQTAAPDSPARLKSFVPQFTSSLSVSVSDCLWSEAGEEPESAACPLVLSLGSASAAAGALTVNCSTGAGCSATLSAPPWNTWIRVVVETTSAVPDNRTVAFNVTSIYTVGCKPKSVGLAGDDYTGKLQSSSISISSSINITAAAVTRSDGSNATSPGNGSATATLFTNASSSSRSSMSSPPSPPPPPSSGCVWSVPVLWEELDVLSLRYTPVNGPNVSVARTNPTLLTYPLTMHHATGGTLNLQLTLNTTNVVLGNSSSVVACLSPWAPVLLLNNSEPCQTALFPGYSMRVNTSHPKAVVRLPFPQSATWYLSLQLTCSSRACGNVSVVSVVPEVSISACVDDCGVYGECRLLRSYSYLYAACACKAGWSGWGCTDDRSALSVGRQVTAAVLLTISNLMFIPATVVAVRRCYITEASVYIFTMFFSTFYHACDQPGVAALCIMDYDTLQYCDFLGSVSSFWVTILCMARLPETTKHVMFMLGALLIAMSLQLDRRGLWNMLGPILFASLTMASAWVYRGVRQRHCYPPSWRRWMLFLVPGLVSALIGVCVYIFAETEDNYYYTHSLWHVLVAVSIVFLLPPREKHCRDSWWGGVGWVRGWRFTWRPQVCGYTLCQSDKDELYTVT